MGHQQVIAAGRRLLGTAQPSPAMERFLAWLAETPYTWRITDGKIRAGDRSAEVCAVTGVVRHRTGLAFSVGDWVRAADVIGLSYREAGRIVEAADVARPRAARTRRLRRRLLGAARIARSPAPSATPDPMDQALADLIAAGVGEGRDPRSVQPARDGLVRA